MRKIARWRACFCHGIPLRPLLLSHFHVSQVESTLRHTPLISQDSAKMPLRMLLCSVVVAAVLAASAGCDDSTGAIKLITNGTRTAGGGGIGFAAVRECHAVNGVQLLSHSASATPSTLSLTVNLGLSPNATATALDGHYEVRMAAATSEAFDCGAAATLMQRGPMPTVRMHAHVCGVCVSVFAPGVVFVCLCACLCPAVCVGVCVRRPLRTCLPARALAHFVRSLWTLVSHRTAWCVVLTPICHTYAALTGLRNVVRALAPSLLASQAGSISGFVLSSTVHIATAVLHPSSLIQVVTHSGTPLEHVVGFFSFKYRATSTRCDGSNTSVIVKELQISPSTFTLSETVTVCAGLYATRAFGGGDLDLTATALGQTFKLSRVDLCGQLSQIKCPVAANSDIYLNSSFNLDSIAIIKRASFFPGATAKATAYDDHGNELFCYGVSVKPVF